MIRSAQPVKRRANQVGKQGKGKGEDHQYQQANSSQIIHASHCSHSGTEAVNWSSQSLTQSRQTRQGGEHGNTIGIGNAPASGLPVAGGPRQSAKVLPVEIAGPAFLLPVWILKSLFLQYTE